MPSPQLRRYVMMLRRIEYHPSTRRKRLQRSEVWNERDNATQAKLLMESRDASRIKRVCQTGRKLPKRRKRDELCAVVAAERDLGAAADFEGAARRLPGRNKSQ